MLFGSPVITAPELVRVLLDDVEPDVRDQMGVTGKPTQNQWEQIYRVDACGKKSSLHSRQ